MTVNTLTSFTDWAPANGVVKNWTYDFKNISQDTLYIEYKDGLDGEVIRTQSNLAYFPDSDSVGGYARYPDTGSALATGYYVRVVRLVEYKQEEAIGNQGRFAPETHEVALDKLEFQIQQVARDTARSLKGEYGVEYETLPALTPGVVLQVGEDGLSIINGPTAEQVASAGEDADRAEAAADRAEEVGGLSLEAYSNWLASAPTSAEVLYNSAADGVATTFTLSQSVADSGQINVYFGGVIQRKDDVDYTVSGTTLTPGSLLANGTTVYVERAGTFGLPAIPGGYFATVDDIEAGLPRFIVDAEAAYDWLHGGFNQPLFTGTPDKTFTHTAFGGLFNNARSVHAFQSDGTGTHSAPYFTLSATRITDGSGTNGPSYADFVGWLHGEKRNWLSSTTDGEVGVLYLHALQGKYGDVSGILIDIAKRGGSGRTGGGTPLEIYSRITDDTGTDTLAISAIFGFTEGAGGFSNEKGIASMVEARTGAVGIAYGGSDRVDLSASFEYLLNFSITRNPAGSYFHVTGTGHSQGQGLIRTTANGNVLFPDYSWINDSDSGVLNGGANVVTIATGGVARMNVTSTSVDVTVPVNAAAQFQVASTAVVGTRRTGWATATGTATRTTFATSTVTLSELAERVKALIDDLHATAGHGLIGT